MILPINDKYRIKSDANQWMVQEYRGIDKKSEEEIWKSVLYYSNIEALVQKLSERMLRESKVDTLALALKEVESIASNLSLALSPTYLIQKEPVK
jgi:hypothetical protein